VIEEIAAFAARYPEARIVVTSRIIGYEADRLRNCGFIHATLEEFDDRQVREFLLKWHDAAIDEPKDRARLQGQLEIALAESRAVRELAGNPLLLTMTAILNRTQPLPRNRVELYEQASRVLLHEWDASRYLPVDTFARQEKEGLLRELAGAMQKREGSLAGNIIDRASLVQIFRAFLHGLGEQNPNAKATSLVSQLTERNFILSYAGADRFSFVHRTFLEYFCAAWFVDLFEKKQTLTLQQLQTEIFGQRWKDETWHEVLRLIAGMVGEKKSEELIRFLIEQDGRHARLANLMLAAECLGEVRNRRMIQGTDDAVKSQLLERAIRYDTPYYHEPLLEYDECGATREKAVGLLAGLWREEGTRLWLSSAAEGDRDWIVRRAALHQLARGWKEDPETLLLVKDRARSDESIAVRWAAVQELARGWKEDSETLPWLKDRARSDEDNYVRWTAVEALARGWKEDPETLPWLKDRARSDEDNYVRWAALQELARGWKEDPETLPFLKDRARSDESDDVRMTALQELARGWKEDPEVRDLLDQSPA
jgi:predicted NACHT family NTPase